MTSLLHLDSSADRSGGSVSRQLTALFARTWRARHGDSADYRYRDLAAEPVPPLDSGYCALGRRVEQEGRLPADGVAGLAADPAEQRAWELTRPLVAELLAADTVLIGAPMYNYSVSASLKAWMDRVNFPGAFTDPATGDQLLRATRVVVVSARGGAYGPGTPREAWDFQTPYLRAYLESLGLAGQNLRFVSAEMTLSTLVPQLAEFRPLAADSLAAARAELTALAGLSGPAADTGLVTTGACGG
ncbi:FMN-dependent NADH-azoreductase [Streptacidiphilus sp. N1-3]|uniref:FMN dependent NADH:quinone oxidoreductase n=1 Tax=Streptacidiphilus alkalitolerans TaxID=3342712 RepID=A0ABV6XE16_9ACTN